MKIEELKEVHPLYAENQNEWLMFKAAYGGTKSLLDWGALVRHTREKQYAYSTRKKNAYSFNYTYRIVSLINSYIFQKPSANDYGSLADDVFFKMFLDDANLEGKTFTSTINDLQKWASVFGHMGILVDKPNTVRNDANGQAVQRMLSEDLAEKVYPFITAYSPLSILNWKAERIKGRPTLTYLKLLEDSDTYRIWTLDGWEVYQINPKTKIVKLIDNGVNTLGHIPFVFMMNEESEHRFLGKSDIVEISRIDIEIMRLLSGTAETFNLASFPMLMKPRMPALGKKHNDQVGQANVIEFDSKQPESKPEWLKTQIAEPITTISDWIIGLVNQMYSSINANGLNSTSQAKSGEALKREFQALNAFLTKKSKITIEKTEKNIIYFWLLWQNQIELFDDVSINRPTDFDISSLSEELENFTIASNMVNSTTFNKSIQKVITKKALPNLTSEQEAEIKDEIEKGRVIFDSNEAANAMDDINNT